MVDPPTHARVSLPSWIWGGNPARLIAECRYRSWPDRSATGFLLQPQETYLRQRPALVQVRTVAGPGISPSRYGDLGALRERINLPMPEGFSEVLEQRRRRVETTSQLIDFIKYQLLHLYAVPVVDLPSQVRLFHQQLEETRFTEDPSDGPFANAAVHLLEVDPVLLHRLKIASVWLRLEQDVRLGTGDLEHVKSISGTGASVQFLHGPLQRRLHVRRVFGAVARRWQPRCLGPERCSKLRFACLLSGGLCLGH